jgi:hypothetical protein
MSYIVAAIECGDILPRVYSKKKGNVIDGNSSGLYFLSLLLFALCVCLSLVRDIYLRLLVEMLLLAMMVEAPQAVQS